MAVASILDVMPFADRIRIHTADVCVFRYTGRDTRSGQCLPSRSDLLRGMDAASKATGDALN